MFKNLTEHKISDRYKTQQILCLVMRKHKTGFIINKTLSKIKIKIYIKSVSIQRHEILTNQNKIKKLIKSYYRRNTYYAQQCDNAKISLQ